MRAAWFFADTIYNDPELDLDWPVGFPRLGMRSDWPGDVRILDEGVVSESQHRHLWLGGIAWENESVGDGHYHYVAYFADQWRQVTMNGAHHDHILDLSANGLRFLPLRAMAFVVGADADMAELELDNKWTWIVDADTTNNEIGDLIPVNWTPQERQWWENHILTRLGLTLPTQVTNGERLVYLFLGSYLTRDVKDDKNWRFSNAVSQVQQADMARTEMPTTLLKAKNFAFRQLDKMPFWLPGAVIVGQVGIHLGLIALGVL